MPARLRPGRDPLRRRRRDRLRVRAVCCARSADPNIVIALVVGIALNPIAAWPVVQPGMVFCVRTVLRWAVALLGLRVGLADIAALGLETALLIIVSMVATVISGFVFASWYGRGPGFGALVGVGTAVCGASATLA